MSPVLVPPSPAALPRRLEQALPIALLQNQLALNSISRLHSFLTSRPDIEKPFGKLVNRTEGLLSGAGLVLKLIQDIEPTDEDAGQASDSPDDRIPPVWQIVLGAVGEIFRTLVPRGESSPMLQWASSSVYRPDGEARGERSALGFEDVVILHSDPNLPVSGRQLLEKAKREQAFRSLSEMFFDILKNSNEQQAASEKGRNCPGVWIVPTEGPCQQPSYEGESEVFVIQANTSSLPPRCSGSTLFEMACNRWLEHYRKYGTLERYFAPFSRFANNSPNGMMNFLFCPIRFVNHSGQVVAGANISLGVVGALTINQVRELLFCMTALQAGLASSTAGFSEAQQRIRQLARSQRMLQVLQRPLDSLTRAFQNVQAEAHELQAILNDPEEGLFRAHRVIADFFQEGRVIQVSRTVAFTCTHDFDAGMDDKKYISKDKLDLLQLAYTYLLCRILGVSKALENAATSKAVIELARSALREARESGVHDNMLRLLSAVCKFNNHAVESSLFVGGLSSGESNPDAGKRFSRALWGIKAICFTPFKSYSDAWPFAPVQLAAFPERVVREPDLIDLDPFSRLTHVLPPSYSPFPQQAILSFICGVRLEIKGRIKPDKDAITDIAVVRSSTDTLEEYRLTMTEALYEPKRDANNSLRSCIQSTARFGIAGRNLGSFLGIFQDLLRHGVDVTDPHWASIGSWVVIDVENRAADTQVLMSFGRVSDAPAQAGAPVRLSYDRYFYVIQEKHPGQDNPPREHSYLRIIWSDCRDTKPIGAS